MPATMKTTQNSASLIETRARKRSIYEDKPTAKKIRANPLHVSNITKGSSMKTKLELKDVSAMSTRKVSKVKDEKKNKPIIQVIHDSSSEEAESTDNDSSAGSDASGLTPTRNSGSSKQYVDPLENVEALVKKLPPGVLDIFESLQNDQNNSNTSPEYLRTYTQYVWQLDSDLSIRPNKERRKNPSSTVTSDMRHCLVDWLFDISQEYRAQSTTFYLSVSLLDRALDFLPVRREKLQLLGCACFLIAAKMEEVNPPTIEAMLDISARSYDQREMVECEMLVSKTLEFRLNGITSIHFLIHFLKISELNAKQEMFAKYLCDLSILDYGFVGLKPSLIAASVIYLTRLSTLNLQNKKQEIWTSSLVHYTNYYPHELEMVVRRLRRCHFYAWEGSYSAVPRKYQHSESFHVSELLCIPETSLQVLKS